MESKTSKGRPKVVLEKIENEEARKVSFSKRRGGLFKKAMELHTLCGAETAIVVFSPSGKPYSIGHPSVEAVTNRFLGENSTPEPSYVGAYRDTKLQKLNEEYGELLDQLETEKNKAEKHKEEMEADQNQPWWEQPIENLEFQQLELLHATYQNLMNKTEAQMNQNKVFISNSIPSFGPQMYPINALGGSHYEANPHPNSTAVVTWGYPTGFGGAGKY